jgi:Xaa-Pro aminopeptidase
MKACKNDAELRGMREAHIRDGAAMAEFLSWLEAELIRRRQVASTGSSSSSSSSSIGITEVEIDEHLTEFRKSYGQFLDLSFPTIAGVGSNGAIIHYRAVPESCKTLSDNDILLLDSGGQYVDGTTDVTRTFHTGTPSAYQREIFTRVLKGHIGIDRQVFPVGTQGCLIDSFAREHLWAIGKDFLHGVGHGVGAALNVHEGPHSISRALIAQPLVPGVRCNVASYILFIILVLVYFYIISSDYDFNY